MDRAVNEILRITEGHDELVGQDGVWKIEFIAREGGLDWCSPGSPFRGGDYRRRSACAPSALRQSGLWSVLLRQFTHAPPPLVFDGRLR